MNPPYGRCHLHKVTRLPITAAQFKDLSTAERKAYDSTTIGHWIKRCYEASRDYGSEVIALIPAAVATKPWQEIIFPTANAVCFPNRRVDFDSTGEKKSSPPHASGLIYWGSHTDRFSLEFGSRGTVLNLGIAIRGIAVEKFTSVLTLEHVTVDQRTADRV